MIRPPRGSCVFMILMASCEHRNAPVRFAATTALQCSYVSSSIGIPGAFRPALLNRTSSRPNISFVLANSARTDSGAPTSVGTASIFPPEVSSSAAARRPASTTEYPADCNARAAARPIPLPAPVTIATFPFSIRTIVPEEHRGIGIAPHPARPMSLADLLFGRPLKSDEDRLQKVGAAAGVPIFGLDALGSSAYGPEAALTLL